MSMNIKSERAHDLARRAAAATGRSQTSVVEEALARYLEQVGEADAQAQRRVWDLLAAVDARLVDSDREAVAAHDLHDEHGLPA